MQYGGRNVKLRQPSLVEAAVQGNMALIKELRSTLSGKSAGQTVPESLDGRDTHDTILDRFRECYEHLYNSAGTEDAMTVIKERLEQVINVNAGASMREVEMVTWQVVKQACCRMRPGKNDVSEVYSSDVFLHAPDSLFEHLAAVFRSFITHGTVSLQILCCAFLPLFKCGLKNPAVCVS